MEKMSLRERAMEAFSQTVQDIDPRAAVKVLATTATLGGVVGGVLSAPFTGAALGFLVSSAIECAVQGVNFARRFTALDRTGEEPAESGFFQDGPTAP